MTIGTVDAGSNLLESIAKFNRQNEECAVSVLNYCVGGRSREDALTALKLDISIGKGPDICVLDEFIDPEELFPNGCFEDLTPWLDGCLRYQKEDFIPQVLEIYTYDGTLMAVPNYFYLRTLTGRTDVVGDKMGWNMDDVKELIRSHPDVKIFDTNGNTYMMNVCMRNMMDVFVDFENGKAAFDSPEFVELLDFLLECASPEKSVEERILDIINEEAAYVFNRSKSAEEVAEVTQNRVQLYLNEQ